MSPSSPRIRVLVVDDSVVVRRLVTDTLAGDPRVEVVGTAANGRIALAKIAEVNPDLVTLDVEMPVMDGLATLAALRAEHPRLPVIMFSTLTERGAASTLEALRLGADDYVTKPANVGSVTASMEAVRAQLVPRIVALASRRRPLGPALSPAVGPALGRPVASAARPAVLPAPVVPARGAVAPGSRSRVEVVAVGVSTGGPEALTRVLSALPADLPVPVVVVQHMPPVFTKAFAERLDVKCALSVCEAQAGMRIEPGRVYVAPGDFHLRFRSSFALPGQVTVALDQGTPEHYCRPAVDVMFRSVLEVWGGASTLAVVLTGMGSDGAQGAAALASAGADVLVQDEATSVVWGMPGAVVAAGVPARVLPLDRIASAVLERVQAGRSAVRVPLSGSTSR